MSGYIIDIKGISKQYGSVGALRNISLGIGRGELFGIIGPDGAGKTTLFRILTTLIAADDGTAFVNGHDISRDITQIRSSVGYMPGRFSLYPDLTVRENLKFFASLFGVSIEHNYDLIAPIYDLLVPFANRPAGKLSGGMKQKLALSCALIHSPEIVFLDEPTTGVDAVSRREFWDVLETLKQRGITIIVSTPYMDEASRCDRIALMSQGRIMRTGTVDELTSAFGHSLYAVSADNMYRLLGVLRATNGVIGCYPFGACHHVITDEEIDLGTMLQHEGFDKIEIKPLRPTVEDLFITLMK